MRVYGMPDTCTARHFYDFPRDNYHSEADFNSLRIAVQEQLNQAKDSRIVNVFAFLIAGSQEKSAKILEEFGFKLVCDYNNYKYPTTSRRLWMYSKDMNDWEIKPVENKPAAPANPFATNATQAAPRTPLTPPRRVASYRYRGSTYRVLRGDVAKLISPVALFATRNQDGVWKTRSGGTVEEPFPLNQWVALPVGISGVIPQFSNTTPLNRHRVRVLRANGRVDEGTWRGGLSRAGNDGTIIAVMRIS